MRTFYIAVCLLGLLVGVPAAFLLPIAIANEQDSYIYFFVAIVFGIIFFAIGKIGHSVLDVLEKLNDADTKD
jgi:hypothetical protein